jgi:hypothetical protein
MDIKLLACCTIFVISFAGFLGFALALILIRVKCGKNR